MRLWFERVFCGRSVVFEIRRYCRRTHNGRTLSSVGFVYADIGLLICFSGVKTRS